MCVVRVGGCGQDGPHCSLCVVLRTLWQEINLGEGGGHSVATLATLPDDEKIRYYSPMHGIHFYVYDASRDAWVGEADDHFLIEIMSRDLIHYCSGLPAF
mgnify:CR=1 FL=1